MSAAALIIGGGITGMQAALDIANAGFKVILVEKTPSIGGHMLQFLEVFPTLDCPQCIGTPKMVEVGSHPNIELMTYSEVEEVSGCAGNFKVKIRKKARYIDEDKCTGCGDCLWNCPVRYVAQPGTAAQEKEESAREPEIEVKRNEVTLEIDGREVNAVEGMTILEAAKSVGIEIPTLCYHPALSPFGACRICSVEITTSKGRNRIVTSCNYTVEEGLVVDTKSPKIINVRKMLAELLLARCPNSKVIQDLAREYGVEKPRFELEGEKCILCGLCTRICEERMGVSAINFVGRGVDREVKTPFQMTLDIDFDVCMGCGACATVCPTGAITLEDITRKKPVPILSEFDEGLSLRAPVYVPFPQAVPNIPVIERDKCVHFITGKCKICQDLCTAEAIDFEQEDKIIEVEVASIVVAIGYDTFDARLKPEYGYGVYPNVITGLEMERLAEAGGPTGGEIRINGKQPKNVVFIQCVGSRDKSVGVEYCSRVCCMYTAKQAYYIKSKIPEARVTVCYIDIRAFGKGYEEFYERVQKDGVIYRRGVVSEVYKKGDKLIVRAEDTLLGELYEEEADLVVLATGLRPGKDTIEMANILGIPLGSDGFFLESHPKLGAVESDVGGIYLAGCCQGPKDIADSVAQASAAATMACITLVRMEKELSRL